MGAIEEVYEDLDTDVEFEEFEAAVEDKVEQMGGLADEETAAMLIAHELRDEEADTIADIEPGMNEVKFLGKVTAIGEIRTFERDDEDAEEGRVCNVDVADASGSVRVALWDDMAAAAEEELEVGQVLRVMGRPKEGYSGLEVSADKVEPDEDAEVDVQVLDTYRVEDLTLGASDVDLVGQVLDTDSIRTFDRDDGSEGRVANLTLGDETGRVRVTLWDGKADLAEEFAAGEVVEVGDGYVRERDGDLELHVGDRGTVERVDEDVEYVPETTDIADLEIGQTVDIGGGVIETDPKRTFDRDDGSEGQVRNVRIKDETGEIRVALWGDKADREIELADQVVFTDVEIQDGWQDDLEASANWRSTVSVLDEGSDAAAGVAGGASGAGSTGGDGDGRGSNETGLGAFSDDGKKAAAEAVAGEAGDEEGSGASGGAATAAAERSDGAVEFTGTVVQTGDPVVLDDGQQTKSVDTDASLRLGEEITVRGPERDGTIDADDVF
ncbi:single-stranded DNA binding protein [Halorubrum ezzemoulense]|uniref:Single-stranded DNA binding protein n=1 Tax=Halorubrum ezzemoulense TaxID=337243 RepID=A0ABT4Z329_HALEZ|nr:single-stranded DNA binding protein [Halorubrum ezzemoulense]MDB2245978.1 single-stranded DNA binding protein [Halorubrum ezzemoulense]MDB2252765.1 single-stranded DNA binding protein [Halorubrum ezzemoulense]MDB2279617.1 single-stranded DNA binding protein [Halorubrum ezzemoulense]MDB2286102.1 single-stranded DNA binding protein [Halorubrum ezzemoulense]MDB2289961.1 single-stranded DNA binding protein [Halorubrum ezzemoulense]